MSDEDKRLTRVEQKVDKIGEKVDQTREDVYQIRSDFEIHSALVKEHVSSDDKIVKQFEPLLQEMAYKKKKKEDRRKLLKNWSMKVGILASITSIVYGVFRIFNG